MNYTLIPAHPHPEGVDLENCLLCRARAASAGRAVARYRPPESAPDRLPALGANVTIDPADPLTVLSTAAGRVVIDDATDAISIQPATCVDRNVDPTTGNVDAVGDLFVAGRITDGMRAASLASVVVLDAIEAADVTCARDLLVGAGIAGKSKAKFTVGGNLSARFFDAAAARAKGSVTVQTDVSQSRVIAAGAVAAAGAIYASHVTANGGITCHVLGAPADRKTLVEPGVDQDLVDLCAELRPKIEQLRKQATTIRQEVEPLMRNAKQLTAKQKEQATELLFKADEYETEAEDLLRRLFHAHHAATQAAKPIVHVKETLHPGVTFRFRNLQATTTTPFKGPVAITAKRVDHNATIIVTDCACRSFVPLETTVLPTDPYAWLEQTLKPAKAA